LDRRIVITGIGIVITGIADVITLRFGG